ncbi:class I SAM-dependent methyltransferase [Sebaldella sp. S0638]|uniref:class I SAM-dependent methyltransferase n=1 Tax=Sebaldella sp. S0638 TaxID=2957809 RepID=UPI00209F8677|nr:class I SAM-dependent methyltransferase [Sebaldella sp. S0638]MCP1226396.1 class I SAM-dependent methyltransferase [Sebaldella sp. S0638]
MSKEYVYSDYTYNSKNPLVRFSHRKRFSTALNLISKEKFENLLDYGAGDGHFLNELSNVKPNVELAGFEPIMHNTDSEKIKFHLNLSDIKNQKYDVITCFEVLEHFNLNGQDEILGNIHNLLNKNGTVVISVPIEIYFPSLIKNVIRIKYTKLDFKYIKNILKAAFARDIPEIRNEDGYISTHLGFNHKKLEGLFKKHFKIVGKIKSPLKWLPISANSQVFYKLEKKNK